MLKLILAAIVFLFSNTLYSQQIALLLKKKDRTIDRYWEGSTIAFQLTDKSWIKG